jgi:hypothetical protein
MIQLPSCSSCGGFIGLSLNACPHCGASLSRGRAIAIGLLGAVGGSAVSMTLMACYGMSCADANCYPYPDAESGDASDAGDASSKDSASDATVDASDASDATTDALGDSATDSALDAPIDVATGG